MTQIDGGIGPWSIKQDQTFGYMTISIVNTGSPTALLGWHMQLKTETGKLYDGENTWAYTPTNPPAPLDQIILRGKENSPSRTLYRSDLLPVKTVRQVIGTGAEVEGFLLAVFNVPHGPATGKAQMIVTVEDARGQKYKLESTSVVPGDAMDLKGIPGMGPP